MARLDEHRFTSEGTAAVHSLRRALADLLQSVGADPSEPQELARRFKLDKTLTWRISRVIREEDAWEAVTHIPGRPSIRALIQQLEAGGASRESISAVQDAMAGFERFVEVHSGDRDTLEIMVGVGNRASAAKRLELFRKQGFQANSAAWGVQAATQFGLHMMWPAGEPGLIQTASIIGFVQLRRLRADVPWAIGSAEAWGDDRSEVDAGPVPLFPEDSVDGVPLVRPFCSEELPGLRTKTTPGGSKRFEITDGRLGHTGAATIVLAWRWSRPLSIYSTSPNDCGEHGTHVYTPSETMIHDLLPHRSLTFAHRPTAATYSMLPGGPRFPEEGPDVGRMPIPDDVVSLGAQPPNMSAIEVPRYPDLINHVMTRLGLSANDFHGFRHRVRYPTIPTLSILRHPLLPPP